MKKIYLFYLYDEHDKMKTDIYPAIDGLELIKGGKYTHVLYAWTPNKTVRKSFKKYRDMTKFHEVIHEIDTDEFDKFSDENSETFLEELAVTTKNINDNNTISKQNVYVLSTRTELDSIVYNILQIKRKWFEPILNPDIYIHSSYFKEEYHKLLEFFHFDELLSYVYPLDEFDDIPFSVIEDDTLAIYSHLYFNTYRKDMENHESI